LGVHRLFPQVDADEFGLIAGEVEAGGEGGVGADFGAKDGCAFLGSETIGTGGDANQVALLTLDEQVVAGEDD
jgi:hypothetical protein